MCVCAVVHVTEKGYLIRWYGDEFRYPCSGASPKHVQPQYAAECRGTFFLELHTGVGKHAAACRNIQFFEFMCLSACTGDILPFQRLCSFFSFVL